MSHRSSLAMLALGVLALGACGTSGGGAGARQPIQGIQPTSYVTVEPATTTSTIATAETPAPVEGVGGVSAVEQAYTVQAKDSFAKVANKFQVPGGYEALAAYNQVATTELLIPGQTVLMLPPGSLLMNPDGSVAGGGATNTPTPGQQISDTTAAPAGGGCTYTIKANDNPSKIAAKVGISFDALQAANSDRDFLKWFPVNGTITIPGGADCSALG